VLMSKKYFPDQYDDEEVLLVFKKHPVVMRKGLIYGSLGLLLGMLPVFIKPEISYFIGGIIGGIVLFLAIFFPYWVGWHFSVYVMTDKRFIQMTQKGFFHKSVVDIGLDQIQMVNYEIAGMQETLLGFGTIVVQTYVGDLSIRDVHKPSSVQKKMLEALRKNGFARQAHPAESNE
jgi:fumarate reductase subunit D